MTAKGFRIEALKLQDVPAVAELAGAAFEDDRHTQMKELAQEPFDMKKYTLESMPYLLTRPNCVILKAVDETTGDVMGVCNWGFRGFTPEEMPVVEGRVQPPADPPKESTTNNDTEDKKDNTDEPVQEEKEENEEKEADGVKRLVALTDKDMKDFMEETMPAGTKCLYIIGLTVSPKYQGRGVGSALLRWGTDVCDERGVFAWVHSSAGAWKMYEKGGFEIAKTLKIDLDEYAPCPPPNEGPDAKWGEYVFRYMKYYGKNSGQ